MPKAFLSALAKNHLDSATLYAMVARAWYGLAGPVTVLVVASYFPAEIQGLYYTFGSLIALQSFVELGLSIVLVQFVSHEWAHLEQLADGSIAGDGNSLSRLRGLLIWSHRWYAAVSLLFAIAVGAGGYVFLDQRAENHLDWEFQWLSFVALVGLQINLIPLIALLEGCNQVESVNKTRFLQATASSLSAWVVIFLGGNLWAIVASAGAGVLCSAALVFGTFRTFFLSLWRNRGTAAIDWRTEIWPLQWRFGVNGLVGYFVFSIYTPVVFYFVGTAAAGRIGAILQISNGIQSLGAALVTVKVPTFGVLISHKKYQELDRLFYSVLVFSTGLTAVLCLGAWLLCYALEKFDFSLASRLLPPLETGLFLLAVAVGQVSQCFGYYLIAHKRNPMFVMATTAGLLNTVLVWFLVQHWGTLGAGVANLFVMALIIVPWHAAIWFRCRAQWHGI